MDAQALEAAARIKATLDWNEELATALRNASIHRDGDEDLFAVAKEAEEFIRVLGDPSCADRLRADVAQAIDTALALHSYRLRIKLLRAGVHV